MYVETTLEQLHNTTHLNDGSIFFKSMICVQVQITKPKRNRSTENASTPLRHLLFSWGYPLFLTKNDNCMNAEGLL
jgi:hypothetical protein